jgi:hypothetical protein
MSLTLEANYSKKIGLPGYSSHQYSLTLKTEVNNINQVEAESARLHQILQSSVDREIQKVGFLPSGTNGNGGHIQPSGNGNQPNGNGRSETWACSDKQRDLIIKITDEHKLDKSKVEQLAQDRFGKTVKALNKLEASGLIEELLEQTGQSKPRNARFGQKAGAR